MALANQLAQLPRVLERSRAADVLVAAEHDERRKTVVHGLIGIRETELERMLGGEKRNDLCGAPTESPRLATRWRRLFSSCAPTALSVTMTRTSWRVSDRIA